MTTEKRFVKIREACKITGLSMYFLRNGCRAGTIPYVLSGTTYMINLPLLIKQLDKESEARG